MKGVPQQVAHQRPLKRHDHSPRSPRTVSVPYRNLPEWYVTSTIVPALERDIPLCDPEQEAEEMIAGPSSSPSCAHNPPSHLLVCNPTSHRKSTPAGRDHFLENGPSRLHSTHHSFLHAIHLQLSHVELPPVKRRRNSLARLCPQRCSDLIGTAVGLTVYRLCVLISIR